MVIIDHTTDNVLMAFRFKHAGVKMQAAEEDFEAGGRKFRAGSFIIPAADRAALDATMTLGIGLGVAAAGRGDARSRRAAHRLRARVVEHARAGSARRSHHGVPYVFRRHQAARRQSAAKRRHHFSARGRQRAGAGQRDSKTGTLPLPCRRRERRIWVRRIRPAIPRHGLGRADGARQVRARGGTLITEVDVDDLPELHVTAGVTVENPDNLFVRGSVMRGVVSDRRSPIAYG